MTDWHSYVAGFFDGEGSITIARVRQNNLSDYHCLHVTASQRSKHREILDRIAAEFGGHVILRTQKMRVSDVWGEQAIWQLQEKQGIRHFLLSVQPHCIVKAKQITIALEFLQTFQPPLVLRDNLGRIRGKTLSADEIERRERLRIALREANELGPTKQKPSALPPLDMQHRRRSEQDAIGDPATIRKGEDHPNARLTAQDVRDIRAEFAAGDITRTALAARYRVTNAVIGGIINRSRWKHID